MSALLNSTMLARTGVLGGLPYGTYGNNGLGMNVVSQVATNNALRRSQ